VLFMALPAAPSVADAVYGQPAPTVSDDVYGTPAPTPTPAPAPTVPATPPVDKGVTVYVNYKHITFDVPPVVEKGRTLVPLRAIFEALGAQVGWDGKTNTITAKRGEVSIKLTLNRTKAYRNGKAVALDVPAKLLKNRTLVPLRFVSEALGAQVNWNAKTQVITINLK